MKDFDELTDAEYEAFMAEYYATVIPVELDGATLQLTRRELYDIMGAANKARKVFEAERRRARTVGDDSRADVCFDHIDRLDGLHERLTAALADANK